MSFVLVLTDQAKADLSDVMSYIALNDPVRGESFVDELIDKIRTLSKLPKRCPIAPENGMAAHELRHLIYKTYRIIFTIRDKKVYILRVVHGARQLLEDDVI